MPHHGSPGRGCCGMGAATTSWAWEIWRVGDAEGWAWRGGDGAAGQEGRMLRGKAWGGKGCRTAERRAVLRNDLNFPSGRCLMSISSIYGLLGSWGGGLGRAVLEELWCLHLPPAQLGQGTQAGLQKVKLPIFGYAQDEKRAKNTEVFI